jgi:hypothetical protein
MVCEKIMTEAVLVPCCGKSFCKECTYIEKGFLLSLVCYYYSILLIQTKYHLNWVLYPSNGFGTLDANFTYCILPYFIMNWSSRRVFLLEYALLLGKVISRSLSKYIIQLKIITDNKNIVFILCLFIGITSTLEKTNHCPFCNQENVSIDQLIPNRTLRGAIEAHVEEENRKEPEPMETVTQEQPQEEESLDKPEESTTTTEVIALINRDLPIIYSLNNMYSLQREMLS